MGKSIIFSDSTEAFGLLGKNDEYLNEFSAVFDCKIISRGGQVNFSGHDADLAADALQELLDFHRQGVKITLHEIQYALKMIKNGKGKELHGLLADTILVTAKGKHIRPKTVGQQRYVEALKKNELVFGIGPAGTGKTYLAVVMAAAALRKKSVERIILTRPAVEAGERLGFLPGDLQEKVDPYLRPLYDALQDVLGLELYQKFITRGIIEIAPLAYMRGRTLSNAFIILDEAQNTTDKQMKMFLTRLGFNSKMAITGDLTQIDLPNGAKSGLRSASEILRDVKGIAVCEFSGEDVVRSPLVSRIVAAYEAHER